MKYLIFSDTHGNSGAFEAFLESIKDELFDEIFFLGDFMGYYYDGLSQLRYCRDMGIKCVMGNHDSYFLNLVDGKTSSESLTKRYGSSYLRAMESSCEGDLVFLRSLPKFIELEADGRKIFLCHGSPIDLLEGRIYPDTCLDAFSDCADRYDIIICGNTHHKMKREYRKCLFVNPGSIGQQRDGKGCSYITLDTSSKSVEFRVVTYSIEGLEREVDQKDPGMVSLKTVLRRK